MTDIGLWGVPLAILGGAIRVSTPFIFVSIGECLTERSGRINLGLERFTCGLRMGHHDDVVTTTLVIRLGRREVTTARHIQKRIRMADGLGVLRLLPQHVACRFDA